MAEFEHEHGIKEVILEETMQKAYLDYSMSVIVSRALPDVRDGLKPVHRRILYGMQELGLTPGKPHRKSARLVGDVMGKYHPHGDSSIYDAVVRLAQDFSTRYPLADGQGNFGSMDGDSAAAMRYTEVRMTSLTEEMLKDINKNTVDFVLNFDESEEEPSVLPSGVPNLLVNGSAGIAVGMATNMAPHNMNEVIDGTIEYLKNEDITIDELMKIIKGPDFPTGALIMGKKEIEKAYKTGRGKVRVRARAEIQPFKKRHQIIVTEIPYQVNKANLIVKIAELVRDKRIEGISDIRDESNREGVRIVIDLKRDANPNIVLNKLYQYTQMQTTFGIINLALVNGVPKILTLKELIDHYTTHRKEVVTRRTQFDLDRAEARAHIIEGLKVAIDNIDEIIKIVRSLQTDEEIKEEFTKRFGLTEAQGQAILDMRIKRLSGLQVEKLDEEYRELLVTIEGLRRILESPQVLIETIIEELEEMKEKYSDLRRTVIMPEEGDIDTRDLINDEDVVITLTNLGYIKRMPEGTYKPQHRGGRGVSSMTQNEGDFVTQLFVTSTLDTILFITNFGRIYRLQAYEIPSASRQAKGTAIINLLDLDHGEQIAATIPVSEINDGDILSLMTKQGYIKRTAFKEYENIRKGGIIAINLRDGDRVIGAHQTTGDEEFMAVTRKGQAIRFPEENARLMGRAAMGVIGITLDEDDEVVSFVIANDDKTLAVFSQNGYGKRTKMSEYKCQNRGGKGLITYRVTKKTGEVVDARVLDPQDEVMMINQSGTIIRFVGESISQMGRNTSGVKLMNIKDSQLVSVATYIGEE